MWDMYQETIKVEEMYYVCKYYYRCNIIAYSFWSNTSPTDQKRCLQRYGIAIQDLKT